MRVEQLDYDLPPEFIAQQPVEPRDASRLLVVDRATGTIAHRRFHELPELLSPRDCIVLNDTRVVPARLLGRRAATGGRWEGLFLREAPGGLWELMCQTRGSPRPGETVEINGDYARIVLHEKTNDGHWLVRPESPNTGAAAFLERYGHIPLPPYVRGGQDAPDDRERYQTVFAARPGAVAAPTAGLHFTPKLLAAVEQAGIEIVRLTLHVGLGTFQPIRESTDLHVMHAEHGELSATAASLIQSRHAAGGRVVAVGTTCVRVLETAAAGGELRAWSGETRIFIVPGFSFRAVDALVTNFHLPRSTLLALVYAFAGEDLCRAAYAAAIADRYRFYSYGDAMLIL